MAEFFIEIVDEQDFLPIPMDTIRDLAVAILEDAGVEEGKITIVLVDNDTIHTLNRDFLDHDYPTDVVSFLMENEDDGRYLEGEIAVSTEMAQERAPEFGWPPEHESLLYVTHGLLHLVGHEDASPTEAREMRKAEKHYLQTVGIDVPGEHADSFFTEEDESGDFDERPAERPTHPGPHNRLKNLGPLPGLDLRDDDLDDDGSNDDNSDDDEPDEQNDEDDLKRN